MTRRAGYDPTTGEIRAWAVRRGDRIVRWDGGVGRSGWLTVDADPLPDPAIRGYVWFPVAEERPSGAHPTLLRVPRSYRFRLDPSGAGGYPDVRQETATKET